MPIQNHDCLVRRERCDPLVVVTVVMDDHHRAWERDAVVDYADVADYADVEHTAFVGSLAYGACYAAVLAFVLEPARLEVAFVPADVGGQ